MVDGGSEEAGGSMEGVGGLMVFLVFVDRETETEREDGRERNQNGFCGCLVRKIRGGKTSGTSSIFTLTSLKGTKP